MTPERWQQIEELYHFAQESGRGVLADVAPDLRLDVERLLAQDSNNGILDRPATEFLESPALHPFAAGEQLGPYRIEARLGAGGMGTVYRAEDTRLNRQVALKLLLDIYLFDEESIQRFRREVRAASSLNHPNICIVYDAGEEHGIPFLVMELLEGQTLARTIASHPLPVETILRFGIQICDALECAHAKGIVHRDLKPSNIFVTTRDDTKLLDFGASRKIHLEPGAEGDSVTVSLSITLHGHVLGTVPYMSPEQAQGKKVDARSDLFSLGAVLYEMATGLRAFRGESTATILAEILRGEPTPVRTLNPQVPEELQRIIGKALEKDPADRYQSATEIMVDLRRLRKQLFAPARQNAFPIGRAEPASPLAPRSRRRRLVVWLAVLAACAVLAFMIAFILATGAWRDQFLHRAAAPKIESLAVLPLDNLSGDTAQDYLADGMTDELITMLAKNSTLRIVSRTSVMQYKRAHRPLREIAQGLGVDGVLEGSFIRSGDHVHMTIQLIHAPSDTHLWADSFDRNANDAVSLPREIAQSIARRLHSAVLQPAPARYVRPQAHDAYLRGRYLWFAEKGDEAAKYFKKATELQPDYALGWTGLADYYSTEAAAGDVSPKDSLSRAEAAALKAVSLDDSLAQAHLSLSAAIYYHRWDWARADQECSRAIELDPKFAEAYHFSAKMLSALNRHAEAIEAQRRASELDPFARPWALPQTLVRARDYDAAIAEARARLESNPGDVVLFLVLNDAYRYKGMQKEAIEAEEKAYLVAGDKLSAQSERQAFAQGGFKAVLLWRLDILQRKSPTQYVSPVDLAELYAQLGRREETLALLEQGFQEHSPRLLEVQAKPVYDFLHSDERYRSIIRRTGLPPGY